MDVQSRFWSLSATRFALKFRNKSNNASLSLEFFSTQAEAVRQQGTSSFLLGFNTS